MTTGKEYLAMSDQELMEHAMNALPGSIQANLASSLISMRTAIKNAETTENLARYTKILAIATWGVAAITFLTQIALIVLTFKNGR